MGIRCCFEGHRRGKILAFLAIVSNTGNIETTAEHNRSYPLIRLRHISSEHAARPLQGLLRGQFGNRRVGMPQRQLEVCDSQTDRFTSMSVEADHKDVVPYSAEAMLLELQERNRKPGDAYTTRSWVLLGP